MSAQMKKISILFHCFILSFSLICKALQFQLQFAFIVIADQLKIIGQMLDYIQKENFNITSW